MNNKTFYKIFKIGAVARTHKSHGSAATNMKEMVWDEELAVIAQRWADQCMPGHDHRRNVGE